jgi:hypothetical protein
MFQSAKIRNKNKGRNFLRPKFLHPSARGHAPLLLGARHCEGEARSNPVKINRLDCFAMLAMTKHAFYGFTK